MTDDIRTDLADGVLTVRIHRPGKRNALTVAMYAALAAALERAEADPAVRVVLLRGDATVFTSGNDVADFRNPPPVVAGEERPVMRFLRLLSTAGKPLVAAVTGHAVGVGTTMLLHCDLVYAGTSARLHLPFVNLGLVPEAASTLLLPASLGYQRAAELVLLGEPFSATKAASLGIVTEVVDDATVFDTARAAATKLAGKPPQALRLAKGLLKQAVAQAVEQRMAVESEHFRARLATPEAAEAFQAFAEKRPPDFTRFQEREVSP